MIRPTVEFSEGTYKAIWKAIVYTGDKDLNAFWNEQIKKVTEPVLHYEIIGEYLNGFLDELKSKGSDLDFDMIRNNTHKAGYYRKNYTFPRE